jgi:hypothetical protein
MAPTPFHGISQFDAMALREAAGMPGLVEAALARLGVGRDRIPGIARDQEAYVRSVYERCPRWGWHKKRRLALALAKATLVRETVEAVASTPKRRN